MPADLDAILAELDVPETMWERPDRRDVPLVTIDPEGSRDLDQALALSRRDGGGYRLEYAIADVAAWVAAGSELDRLAFAKAMTVYTPGRRIGLYPPALSEGAGSLLPGQDRPAVLWTIDVDEAGEGTLADVSRVLVRSREQLTYSDGHRVALLQDVGELLIAARRRAGAVEVDPPQQEVVAADGGPPVLRFERRVPAEGWNAQLSLLTGRMAAGVMLRGGVGLLRTMPPPSEETLAAVRRSAAALGVPWAPDVPLGDWVAGLAPDSPMRSQAARVLRGAAYTAFDGAPPEDPGHFAVAGPYAHVTAPLRRLCDRHATEVTLALWAGAPVPGWAREALPRLPDAMAAAGRRASGVERAIIDHMEAVALAARVGEVFRAVVTNVDERGAVLQLRDPAVLARLDGDAELGAEIDVRLTEADPATRRVRFVPA